MSIKKQSATLNGDNLTLDTQRSTLNVYNRLTLAFLIITTLARMWLLPRLELVPDEAYYWDWSRHLALGYYDQGPMVAYVIRLTTMLFGTNEFGVRVGVCIASLGTLICAWLLARRFFGSLAGFLTVLLLSLTPLMTLGSLIATYDPLLVVFWALTLLFLERALFASDQQTQNRAWLGAGFATGLGFLSKHTMLLILPCLFLFFAASPAHRFWLRRPQPYVAFAITLLLYSGVFWWNAHHHWWTFGHLLFLAAKSHQPISRRLGDFIGSQALLVGPGLFLLSITRSISSIKNKNGSVERHLVGVEQEASSPDAQRSTLDAQRFLFCFGLPIFLFFCLMTLKAKAQGNWAPCAWITPAILLAGLWAQRIEAGGQEARRVWRSVAIVGALSGFITLLMLSPDLRYLLGVRLPPAADLSNTAHGWRETAARANQIRQEMETQGRPVFLVGNDYENCAILAFYLPDHPETHDLVIGSRLTMYAAYTDRLKQHLGEDALFVNDTQNEDEGLREIFTSVTWDAPLPIWRRPYFAEPIRTMYFARCRGYRRYTGLEWANGG